jgi:hypothetical protein
VNFLIPEATDALVLALRNSASSIGLAAANILDGPSVTDAGMSGVVVGGSRENPSGDFRMPVSDMSTSGSQTFAISCLAWARSGEASDAGWQTLRRQCSAIVEWADSVLVADRTLGGSVSSAFITDGVFDQEPSPQGSLVTIEFRIELYAF